MSIAPELIRGRVDAVILARRKYYSITQDGREAYARMLKMAGSQRS